MGKRGFMNQIETGHLNESSLISGNLRETYIPEDLDMMYLLYLQDALPRHFHGED
jgi:hypothetical protein